MRNDAEPFKSRNAAPVKYPRIVIEIEFEVESLFLTSHADVTDLPGVPILNVLQDPSALSQRIVPDEARSEIGSLSFSLIDKDSAFTDAIRTRLLDDGYGLRGKIARLYIGYAEAGTDPTAVPFGGGTFGSGTFGGAAIDFAEASFDNFKLFQTQKIIGAAYDAGIYKISCQDITREQREDIFEPKLTTLAVALTDSATTVEVYDTSKFQPIAHGTSYSDAPSTTVGYIKIDKEIIRYTGKTASTFTGCTRASLNTKAVAHTFESTADEDRRPKVEEYIYLEEPCAALAYKVLTGKDALTGLDVWPPHWNLGIDPDLITITDFTGIGTDLWDTTDPTAGFVAYFSGLKKVTGKRFLESEIYTLLGCYPTVYADGTLGLKRMNHVLADSASVVTLNEDNCVSWSALTHAYDKLHNRIRIDWNWTGEEFTRTTLFIDQTSIAIHGESPVLTFQFKGLHGSRHTDALIRTRIDALRDRYSQPPEELSLTVLPSLNILEVGDIAKVNLSTVRDFAAEGDNIDRSFEIQQGQYNFANGTVSFDVFGSTARASPESPTTDTSALPDAFYTDRGTELSTVATIVVTGGVGIIQPGSYTLTGDVDINDDDAVFYYDGDLQLAAGATLTIVNNVQLRHKGFFQINGTIDGIANGKAGTSAALGTAGFIGNARGMDGVTETQVFNFGTVPCSMTVGAYSAFPYLELAVDGNDLLGIPSDLSGTSGGKGGDTVFSTVGGSGGASGAGLVLIGRGLSFGGAGLIDLSGSDGVVGGSIVYVAREFHAGTGGAGSPGALLVLVDGGDISLPDVSGHFTAETGAVLIVGTPLLYRADNPLNQLPKNTHIAGFLDPSYISSVNLSDVAYRIQYIPATQTPQEDQDSLPAAPTALSASGSINKITLRATVGELTSGDRLEFYSSSTNDRTTATRVAYGAVQDPEYPVSPGTTKYHWVRVRRVQPGVDVFSEWLPSSATGGTSATASLVVTDDVTPGAITDVSSTTSNSVTVTNSYHTPNGYGFNTEIATLSYTPTGSYDILLTARGTLNYTLDTASAFGLSFRHSIQNESESFDGFRQVESYDPTVAALGSRIVQLSCTARYAVVSGSAIDFTWMGAKFDNDDTVTVTNIEMRLEAVKR